ncbi:hypothetical protein Tco_0246660 [Tanacetum coccineum]
MTAHHNHWDTSATQDEMSRNISSTTTESPEVVRQLEMMNKNFVKMMRQIQTIKSVDTKCESCGGPHSFTECPAADGYTQEAVYATTGAGSLPCNTIAYTRGYVKAITTKVVLLIVTFDSNILLILSRKWNLDECLALADLGASINLMPLSVWETAFSPDNCEPCMILGIRRTMVVIRKVSPKMFLTTRALIDVYGEELTLRVDDEAITFKVGQTSRYSRSYKTVNQVNVIDVACEEYAQKCSIFG